MKEKSMFASNSLIEHVLRGGLGICLLWFAIDLAYTDPFISLGLGIVTLFLFRGCPICWTIGLFETVYLQYHKFKNRHIN
ncbi:hypothetical protein [Pseudoalteromonas denitrificans]|jgi:hypothetical protein|uniref:DUF2892 domain-containing protein n=1 Tax=Pseudoalteromonas denitrificans DSM 6059 TaxID=1123010 RepID=A0A1I1RJR8_9GAMM|nr:hypothetical protein [Pseudoalteromonas denitrificans]SFD34277.1 hypothetical protein SAMN02745724_04253 [Pseudoalteromonas denitrificans DSM 6059]